MSVKFKHSYNIVGTPASPATLTATLTDNTKAVIIKDLANQMIGIVYTPANGQTNRYAIVTVEVNNGSMATIPTSGWKPFSAALVSASPNEVDPIPTVGIVGAAFGTPIVLPTNSTTPVSTGGTSYLATFNLSLVATWMRISIRESGVANFGTANVEVAIQE